MHLPNYSNYSSFLISELMDRIVLSSTPLSTSANQAVGIFQDDELHITPIGDILLMQPCFHYLEKSDKRAREEAKAMGEGNEEFVDSSGYTLNPYTWTNEWGKLMNSSVKVQTAMRMKTVPTQWKWRLPGLSQSIWKRFKSSPFSITQRKVWKSPGYVRHMYRPVIHRRRSVLTQSRILRIFFSKENK